MSQPTVSLTDVSTYLPGEPIPAEKKNRDPFIFTPRAGHIFATNSPIRSTDHSVGFWRRPLVLGLTRKFEEEAGRILEAGAKVLAAERQAIAAWAIDWSTS